MADEVQSHAKKIIAYKFTLSHFSILAKLKLRFGVTETSRHVQPPHPLHLSVYGLTRV